LRVFHVRRSKHFGLGASDDLVFQQARRTELRHHLEMRRFFENLADFRKSFAQAARSVKQNLIGRGR
jgi:hypothetical protein